MKFNTSNFVILELTDHGLERITQCGFKPNFLDGYEGHVIYIQLWELMHELGEWIFNGSEQSIKGNIIEFPD